MATLLTNLADVKLIAGDDAKIQAMLVTDPIVILVFRMIAQHITAERFGADAEFAQLYCAAHWLSLTGQPVGGRGPLSSVNIGGISRSFTLPYINQKTVYGSTQFGLMYLEYVLRNIVPWAVVTPQGPGGLIA